MSSPRQEFILDEFMEGFLFDLYVQKWRKFGWYIHLGLCALDFAVVSVVSCLCFAIKGETGTRDHHATCNLLLMLMSCFLLVEFWLGWLYALNFKEGVPALELMNRTWAWMSGFSMTNNLLSCTLLTLAVGLYYADPNVFDALEDAVVCPHAESQTTGCTPGRVHAGGSHVGFRLPTLAAPTLAVATRSAPFATRPSALTSPMFERPPAREDTDHSPRQRRYRPPRPSGRHSQRHSRPERRHERRSGRRNRRRARRRPAAGGCFRVHRRH